MFLRLFEVEAFSLQQVAAKGLWMQSRALFRYRHRASGMEVDGAMRHKWLFVGDEIAHFELFHDSPRMRAFYKMTAAAYRHGRETPIRVGMGRGARHCKSIADAG